MILARTIILSMLMIGSYQAKADEAKAVGIVLASQGSVTAKDASGNVRNLTRRSDIFLGDLIDVGSEGKVQLRFMDASLLTLAQNTSFRVDDYKFQEKQGDTFISKLAKGGLRALPGAVEKNDPGFEVNTPVAVMGVRGTLVSLVSNQDGTAIGFLKGNGWLQNPRAQIELGSGQSFDFATIGLQQTDRPQGKMAQPDALALLEHEAPDQDSSDKDEVTSKTREAHVIRGLTAEELSSLLSEIDNDGAFVADPMLKLVDSQVELRSEELDCH